MPATLVFVALSVDVLNVQSFLSLQCSCGHSVSGCCCLCLWAFCGTSFPFYAVCRCNLFLYKKKAWLFEYSTLTWRYRWSAAVVTSADTLFHTYIDGFHSARQMMLGALLALLSNAIFHKLHAELRSVGMLFSSTHIHTRSLKQQNKCYFYIFNFEN